MIMYREKNRKFLAVFLVCATAIAVVTWTLSEKFIGGGVLALAVNLAVALGIAFLFERYLESMLNRSIDFIMEKIARVAEGDLTQRFKEDPDDCLPYGLSFHLEEMMRSFRENVGGLWKSSVQLSRQLSQFIGDIQEALREFRAEVEYLTNIVRNFEAVRIETLEVAKQVAGLKVNVAHDSGVMGQSLQVTQNMQEEIDRNWERIRAISGNIEEIYKLSGHYTSMLHEFQAVFQGIKSVGKTLAEISTESSLIKLNASIDAANEQTSAENYTKITEELQTLLGRLNDLVQESNAVSAMAKYQLSVVSGRLEAGEKNLKIGLADNSRIDDLMRAISESCRTSAGNFSAVFDDIKRIDALIGSVDGKIGEFGRSIKLSTDNFDKLKSSAQMTLLKFNQIEEKAGSIGKGLDQLDSFSQRFKIG
ncbi:MAG: hypothetical protein A2268_12205 [Candidatus Raymondbacteria bacterium RifOxyA12_full_50_37]|uniref:Methyl-accepting transducer domain-containing protein n=1 Tax=Candidatus Raymondbacteria bacterium RIFOXYD12_FULL_49_13 TaxID=1817890 RepID=A0A1F7F2T8_UNCRA|nr:MAG: hypothetical protein A2268_12205 [Candidatus Raymondbacteria bacterium RifOxyA12_full_50_37]OGJ90305.1 MAG: hypothetical protein A2248_00090 [Candidatus Raymondbacteria bacterium RIFOXYA2_FULL_49_16]OGJ94631.1 MAG: hypothetical protein A2350_19275 [Candidatus Raymondbacteria bacterium RifOxyB12_full_50_8]OGJ97295.1 MAG: hypothetical protein A2453_01550 [Candidatus Raymondbacteria bacterium RIFOXYC2_FULL_50_21]OGK00908.1 MAG: hypothetical protein A2519_12720 [Candidatus Raymondbacteria b